MPSGSLAQKLQGVDNLNNQSYREQSKISTTQLKKIKSLRNISGRGLGPIGTTFPITAPIDERINITTTPINIAMASPRHHYVYLDLNVVDPVINLIDLIEGVTTELTIDILISHAAVNSVTFSPALINSPTIGLVQNDRILLHIVASRTSTETRYYVTNGAAGGGGLTEPVILTPNVITPQTLPTKSTIDWNNNPNVITLDRDVEFDFANLPSSGSYEGLLVIIDIDGTGGYASPLWPAAVTNPPVVSTLANTRTSVMLYTIDGGTTVTHATGVGSSTGGNFANKQLSDLSSPVLNAEIDFNTFDVRNVDRVRFTSDSAAPASAGDPSIFLDGSSNMVFNIADQKQWFWTNESETIMQLDRDGVNNDTVLTIETDSADASAVPRFDIFRDDPSPANDDTIALIRFIGTESALGNNVYGQIEVEYENVTAGREAASMIFAVSWDSGATTSFLPFMAINTANDKRIRMIEDVEIVQDIILQSGAGISKLFFDGGGDTYFTGSGTTGRINIFNDNVNTAAFNPDAFSLFGTVNLEITAGHMLLGEIGDPAAGTNSGKFYVKDVGGISKPFFIGDGQAAIDLTSGGSSQTPWTSDIDGDGFKLQDSGAVEFRDISGTPLGSVAYIAYDAPNMFINVPTANGMIFRIDSVQKLGIGSSSINMFTDTDFNGNDLILNANGDTIISATATALSFQIDSVSQALEFQLSNGAGSIHWPVSGFGHSISASTTNLQFDLGVASDSLTFIWASDADTKMVFTDNHIDTRSDSGLFFFESIYNPTTPADGNTFALYQWNFKNSIGTIEPWAQMQIIATDVTNGTEDAQINYSIMNAGTLSTILQMNAASSNLQMGFFGVTPVAQQSPAATSAAIITALENLGLFV